jgi:hypothetical protein
MPISNDQYTCQICSQPVDLSRDLCTDEDGRIVHQTCYLKRITMPQDSSANLESEYRAKYGR